LDALARHAFNADDAQGDDGDVKAVAPVRITNVAKVLFVLAACIGAFFLGSSALRSIQLHSAEGHTTILAAASAPAPAPSLTGANHSLNATGTLLQPPAALPSSAPPPSPPEAGTPPRPTQASLPPSSRLASPPSSTSPVSPPSLHLPQPLPSPPQLPHPISTLVDIRRVRASLSSTLERYAASLCMDEDLTNFCHSSERVTDPWLSIEIAADSIFTPGRSTVSYVWIVNRCPYQERLAAFEVWVGDEQGAHTAPARRCASMVAPALTPEPLMVACHAVGNFITVVLPGEGRTLNLAEVRVLSDPTPSPPALPPSPPSPPSPPPCPPVSPPTPTSSPPRGARILFETFSGLGNRLLGVAFARVRAVACGGGLRGHEQWRHVAACAVPCAGMPCAMPTCILTHLSPDNHVHWRHRS
jgi:hypothetical protein